MGAQGRNGATFYSRSGYGSTASASTETTSSGQLSSMLELTTATNVRLSSSLRVFGRLGQQGDLVLLDDAKPHSITLHCALYRSPTWTLRPPGPTGHAITRAGPERIQCAAHRTASTPRSGQLVR